VSRVGPFNPGDKITKEQAEQMDAYMLRVWVEIGLYLHVFKKRNGESPRKIALIHRHGYGGRLCRSCPHQLRPQRGAEPRWLSHVLVQSMLCEESI
jgi:hypothetical protein